MALAALENEAGRVSAKRNLRVAKWIGTTPAVGVCTRCAREFSVPVTSLKRLADAQQSLTTQFNEHECNARPSES